jgi:beta-glucanase (GH16 family)
MSPRVRRLLPLAALACAAVCAATLAPSPASAGFFRPPRPPAPAPAPPPPPPVCGDATPVKADGTPYICTFDDEFDDSALDATKWLPLTTSMNGVKAGSGCFVNDSDNIAESDGALHLTVRKEDAPFVCSSPKGNFLATVSAGQVTTSSKFSQTYGRFSIRARFPVAAAGGVHSAFWLWPQDPYTSGLLGEIDVAEVYSALNDRAIPYLHYLMDKLTVNLTTNTNIFTNNSCLIDVTQFHTYTLDWSPGTLTISFDDQVCLTDNVQALGTSPFDQPYMITLTESLGVGTNAPTANTTLPSTMDVDWVRVWK